MSTTLAPAAALSAPPTWKTKIASGSPKGALRVLVGLWAKVRSDPAASLKPVDEAVLAELALEIAAADRNWEALRG